MVQVLSNLEKRSRMMLKLAIKNQHIIIFFLFNNFSTLHLEIKIYFSCLFQICLYYFGAILMVPEAYILKIFRTQEIECLHFFY